ncbi:type II toxin-antitoxin system VapC family toxin [Nevskia sp.]|uniref:type II toxin-antitoxin system VapC family toxin n=1 Tax=Nevskia sp. TaxID=1929292 RepID=UPI003F718E84
MSDALRYLLDTNIISSLAKLPQGPVLKHLKRAGEGSVCTSIVVACELRFGLAKSGSSKLATQVEAILAPLPILPLEAPVDEHYADIRASLEREGTPIVPNDLLIAAHARALGLTLVTDNVREFGRVAGLAVENWLVANG